MIPKSVQRFSCKIMRKSVNVHLNPNRRAGVSHNTLLRSFGSGSQRGRQESCGP